MGELGKTDQDQRFRSVFHWIGPCIPYYQTHRYRHRNAPHCHFTRSQIVPFRQHPSTRSGTETYRRSSRWHARERRRSSPANPAVTRANLHADRSLTISTPMHRLSFHTALTFNARGILHTCSRWILFRQRNISERIARRRASHHTIDKMSILHLLTLGTNDSAGVLRWAFLPGKYTDGGCDLTVHDGETEYLPARAPRPTASQLTSTYATRCHCDVA